VLQASLQATRSSVPTLVPPSPPTPPTPDAPSPPEVTNVSDDTPPQIVNVSPPDIINISDDSPPAEPVAATASTAATGVARRPSPTTGNQDSDSDSDCKPKKKRGRLKPPPDDGEEDKKMSAGQLCDLQTRPVHVASRTAIYGFSTISDEATALR